MFNDINPEIVSFSLQIGLLLISFFLGRYTSYREDCRTGMKELNEKFYRPFINLYETKKHGYAMRFVDFPLDFQTKMVELLLSNCMSVSPVLQKHIYDLDAMYSGYKQQLEEGEELTEDEMECVEVCFHKIRRMIEKQYKITSRKLYCTWMGRQWYRLLDCFVWTKCYYWCHVIMEYIFNIFR